MTERGRRFPGLNASFSRVDAVIVASAGLRNVRSLQEDEKVIRVDDNTFGDLVDVARKVHSARQGTEDIFRKRLLEGEKAYLLQKAGTAVCYQWLSAGPSEVYDLRISLRMPAGGGYFFDGATVSECRRSGILGKTLAFIWNENSLVMAASCILRHNHAALSVFDRLGFQPIFTVTLTRQLFLRMHTIQNLGTGAVGRTFSLATLRPNPKRLVCCIGKTGLDRTQIEIL